MCRNYTSKSDAARIQSSQAKSGGDMSSGGFAARAQSAGDRNVKSESASFISYSSEQSFKGQGTPASSKSPTSGSEKK
ncbi:hypothetical protein N7533_013478 [Penicillium manginii]|uniref:uncharacterized protein n=1 Tax=Penicillium manginii TaxID=203109 RepID=UPI0025480380|nr:uncharacterized protein N7533_013478 [Penicillium manginii]KAJ5733031.1 hypothetical protein N7533_013478 [Penicillium manginii]